MLKKMPAKGSTVRYLGGYDSPNCLLEVGKVYKINSSYMTVFGFDVASITMEKSDVSESYWYIKGVGNKGHGNKDSDFDKFELVSERLTRDELLALNGKYEAVLKNIVINAEDMLDNYVEESGVVDIRDLAKNALDS